MQKQNLNWATKIYFSAHLLGILVEELHHIVSGMSKICNLSSLQLLSFNSLL